jgi:hypothetical protein
VQKYDLTIDKLLDLNPGLDEKCQTIKPDTEYCVVGCKWIDSIIRAIMLLTSNHSSSRADAGLGWEVWFTSWQCFVFRDAEAVL